jgi:hypothetical protein
MSASAVTLQVGAQFTKDAQSSGDETGFTRQPYAGLIVPLDAWSFGAVLSSSGSGDLPSIVGGRARYLLREARFVAAWREPSTDRIALGAALVLPTRSFDLSTTTSSGESQTGISLDLGTIVRLPGRILAGASYHRGYDLPGVRSSGSLYPNLSSTHEGRLGVPDRLEFGLGWIANRFLKVGSSFSWIRPDSRFRTFDGALTRLSQQAGYRWAMGADLQWLETEKVFSRLTFGTYLEPAGTVEAVSAFRPHGTASLEFEYGIAQLSGAVDHSTGYQSYVISAGIELGRLAQRLKVVPPSLVPSPGGLINRETFDPSDDWLPTHLQESPTTSLQTIAPSLENFRTYIPKALERLPDQIEGELTP